MKHSIFILIVFGILFSTCKKEKTPEPEQPSNPTSTPVPAGQSKDSITGSDGYTYVLHYYKPTTYNPSTGSILWAIHGWGGQGSDGSYEITVLKDIADKRNVLLLAPTMPSSDYQDGIAKCASTAYFIPTLFKEIYTHVKQRENRSAIDVYMTGFSAGAQCVTRYLLLRQYFTDGIPLKGAVSANPRGYIFCTSTYNSTNMYYPYGLSASGSNYPSCVPNGANFIINQHVIQYYGENYGVMIGTADTLQSNASMALLAQGKNRYERAKNFYNFSVSDAAARNASLSWTYTEIAGVAHSGWNMYHKKANPSDNSSIFETILFD